MTRWLLLICVLVLPGSGLGDQAVSRHTRRCCPYAHAQPQSLCSSPDMCLAEAEHDSQQDSAVRALPIHSCRIEYDSKSKNNFSELANCMQMDFEPSPGGPLPEHEHFPLLIKPYMMLKEDGSDQIPALELLLLDGPPYPEWSGARFRLSNQNLCSEHAESGPSSLWPCLPRCVAIQKPARLNTSLVYDCEGSFVSKGSMILSTVGHTYQLDACFSLAANSRSMCESLLFEMPPVQPGIPLQHLILVRRKPLTEQGKIDLVMSEQVKAQLMTHFNQSQLRVARVAADSVALEARLDQETWQLSLDQEALSDGGLYQISLLHPPSMVYNLAQFSYVKALSPAPGFPVTLTAILILLVMLLVLGGVTFERYRWVQKSHRVCPQRLVQSGRIRPKEVFIISNVDNRHHIEIVLALSKYLKEHCAVGQVHFALDPLTGIASDETHDPWRWAQSAIDKVSKNGFLIFVAAPPPKMGICIYKDLPNNQAFISTYALKRMVDEKRVATVILPYSDLDTLPSMVPHHIRSKAFMLPRDMNSFLCQLLEVRRRELCPCLPYQIVQPQVLPAALEHFHGGKELVQEISSLCAKVQLFKIEMAKEESGAGVASSTISRVDDLEVRQLLKNQLCAKKAAAAPSPAIEAADTAPKCITVDLEANMFSLAAPSFQQRDKSVCPEAC